MGLSDHYRGGATEKMMVSIITSDPATNRIEAVGRDAAVIQVLPGKSPLLRWPAQGEYWIVLRENGIWSLDSIVENPESVKKIVNLQPGESIADTTRIWLPSGEYLLTTVDGNALHQDIVTEEAQRIADVNDLYDYIGGVDSRVEALSTDGLDSNTMDFSSPTDNYTVLTSWDGPAWFTTIAGVGPFQTWELHGMALVGETTANWRRVEQRLKIRTTSNTLFTAGQFTLTQANCSVSVHNALGTGVSAYSRARLITNGTWMGGVTTTVRIGLEYIAIGTGGETVWRDGTWFKTWAKRVA